MTERRALVVRHNWQPLIDAGRFEPEKAMLSLQAASRQFLQASGHNRIADVLRIPTATLATLKKYRGEETMLAVVENLLKTTLSLLNVGKGMSEQQVASTAEMIFSQYYYLTVADLKVCFQKAVRGEYGPLYDRMDCNTALEWLAAYDVERLQYAEMKSRNEALQFKEEGKRGYMPEWLSGVIREMETAKHKKLLGEKPKDNSRFANLRFFLAHIGKDTDADIAALVEALEDAHQRTGTDIDFPGFALYWSNALLVRVNNGELDSYEGILKQVELI